MRSGLEYNSLFRALLLPMAVVEYVEVVDFDDEEGGGEAPAEEAPAEGEQRGIFDRGVWIWYGPKNVSARICSTQF